jgi:mono/diheme cytochrome c family protein
LKKSLVLVLASLFIVFLCCRARADRQPGPGNDPAAQVKDNGIGPIKSLNLGPVDKSLADKGKAIFEDKCAMCHALNEERTGPALGNVLNQVTPEFVMNFILNTAEMEQKDPRITNLIQKFGMPMPPPGLDQDQARAVLEYFRTTKK